MALYLSKSLFFTDFWTRMNVYASKKDKDFKDLDAYLDFCKGPEKDFLFRYGAECGDA